MEYCIIWHIAPRACLCTHAKLSQRVLPKPKAPQYTNEAQRQHDSRFMQLKQMQADTHGKLKIRDVHWSMFNDANDEEHCIALHALVRWNPAQTGTRQDNQDDTKGPRKARQGTSLLDWWCWYCSYTNKNQCYMQQLQVTASQGNVPRSNILLAPSSKLVW